MSVVQPGQRAPQFSLATEDGGRFTDADLEGHTSVLAFYPFAFSPVCTDQLTVYEEILDELAARSARLYGVSWPGCDEPVGDLQLAAQLAVAFPTDPAPSELV